MFNQMIHNKIQLMGEVINDLRGCENDIELTSDPSLIQEFNEEKERLIVELDEVGQNCIKVLEAYMEDCKRENIPVYIDYWRVLVALKNAVVIG